MIVKDVIERVSELRPGSVFSIEEYLNHLNAIEEQIYNNIIMLSDTSSEYTPLTTREDSLAVPDMYGSIYIHYITAQIDIANGDITRYSNNMILYNSILSAYSDWYIRTHMPEQRGKLRWC